jgi:hypothetical protein
VQEEAGAGDGVAVTLDSTCEPDLELSSQMQAERARELKSEKNNLFTIIFLHDRY